MRRFDSFHVSSCAQVVEWRALSHVWQTDSSAQVYHTYTYGCVWIERTNVERKKRKENKPKQNTRMHNNERVLTQLLHSDIRYDMSWKKTLAHLRTLVYLLQLFILRATIRYRFISYQLEFREWNHDRLENCMIQIFSTGYSDEITRFSILFEIKLFDNYIIYIYKFLSNSLVHFCIDLISVKRIDFRIFEWKKKYYAFHPRIYTYIVDKRNDRMCVHRNLTLKSRRLRSFVYTIKEGKIEKRNEI